MLNRLRLRPLSRLLSGFALVASPGAVAAAPRAMLVHCGVDTCLRVTGKRAHAAVEVRIAGRAVAVAGAGSWHATLPLAATRSGVDSSGQLLVLTLVDPLTGVEQVQTAILPPGALGRPVELASLVVYAH